MIRGGKFEAREILSLAEHIKKLSLGKEAMPTQEIYEAVCRREKILSKEIERGFMRDLSKSNKIEMEL